jgi:hypothetical protein
VQAREIVILVTGAASHRIHAVPVRSTVDLHCVSMVVVTLTGKISLGVAIHTTRMAEHRDNRFESGSSAGIVVRRRFLNVVRCGMFHSLHRNP